MFRRFQISSSGCAKLKSRNNVLLENDFIDSFRSTTPGEWIILFDKSIEALAMINQYATDDNHKLFILELGDKIKYESTEEYLQEKILKAINRRFKFEHLRLGCRLVYGEEDGLSGVVIDLYENCILLQTTHLGMHILKDAISAIVKNTVNKPCFYILNNVLSNKHGVVGQSGDTLPDVIQIVDNGMKLSLPNAIIQKNGYYYDHRDNRSKMNKLLSSYHGSKKIGLDLFSYAGSWGLHLLKAGFEYVEFVDQADLEAIYKENLKLNDLSDNGEFIRDDVFNFITKIDKRYDVIVCDPPAFAKSRDKKNNALAGYSKLYTTIIKYINDNGFLVAASCTKEVSLDDLDKIVQEALRNNSKKASIIDYGGQSFDHPYASLKSRSNYIKYLMYQLE